MASAARLELKVILADINAEKAAGELWRILSAAGWLNLCAIEFVTIKEIGLSDETDDLTIWSTAQQLKMLLLTFDRNMDGSDSLEETIRQRTTSESLPVLTIGNQVKFNTQSKYREDCAARLFEIVFEIESYLGVSRLYIP